MFILENVAINREKMKMAVCIYIDVVFHSSLDNFPPPSAISLGDCNNSKSFSANFATIPAPYASPSTLTVVRNRSLKINE